MQKERYRKRKFHMGYCCRGLAVGNMHACMYAYMETGTGRVNRKFSPLAFPPFII